MKSEVKSAIKVFVLELLLYAALVTAYFFLVLHLMGDWLFALFNASRGWYTVVALALIMVQGVFLETLTRYLVSMLQPREEPPDL